MPRQRPQLAKLTRPRLHGALARERLFAKLDAARDRRRAICVVGPPGAGKTTVVATWLDTRRLSGIWYQVDSGDADLATFFYYLGQASTHFSSARQRSLPALTPEYLHDIPGFTRRFFRQLFARLPASSTLVLDNYQEVLPDQRFHAVVAQAIDEVPDGVTLIVVSRRDPPDTYARLIAHENVGLLDWDDLKLTLEEARAIAGARAALTAEELARLYVQSGGWAAGLMLLLQGTRQLQDNEIASREALFGYFASIVFGQVTDEIQEFLMRSALLPQVTASMAERLTGNIEASKILDDLYRRRLFTHRRSGEPPTYHYHALFQEFLRGQARQRLQEGELDALRAKAARLLEEAQLPEAATALYLEAQTWVQATRLIVQQAPALLASGRWQTLQEWVGKLPPAQLLEQPWLPYWVGRSRFGIDTPRGREELLRALEGFQQREDRVGQIMSLAGVRESHWFEWTGFRSNEHLIDRMLELLDAKPAFPADEMELQVNSVLLLALSHSRPDYPVKERVQDRIMTLLSRPLDDNARLLAGTILLGQALAPVDVSLGAWTVEVIGKLPDAIEVSALSRMGWFVRLACHLVHRGEYTLALQSIRRTEAIAEQEGLSNAGLLNRCWWGAFVHLMAGDATAATNYANRLESWSGLTHAFKRGVVANIRCMIALSQGDVPAAVEHGRVAAHIAWDEGPAWSVAYFGIPTAFALIEAGEVDEARNLIVRMRAFLRDTFIDIFEIELQLADAYVLLCTGSRADAAVQVLGQALALARRRTYVFLWRGLFRPHRLLLGAALRVGVESAFVRQTIRQYRIAPGAEADEHWPWAVRIYTLGRFEVLLGDKPLTFGQKMPRRLIVLLKVLVALGGREVPEHKLLELLWPDEEGDAAHHALSVAIHRLRRLLGAPECVRVEDGALSLDRTRVWVDAFQAMEALTAVVRTAKGGTTGTPEGLIDTVTALYKGVFLPGDADAPWSISTRERMRAAFIDFVTTHGHHLETQEAWQDAAQWYGRGIAADDLSESFYQGLMRCQLQLGSRAEGLSTFRRMRQTLSVTLGIQPSPVSEALYRAMQAR